MNISYLHKTSFQGVQIGPHCKKDIQFIHAKSRPIVIQIYVKEITMFSENKRLMSPKLCAKLCLAFKVNFLLKDEVFWIHFWRYGGEIVKCLYFILWKPAQNFGSTLRRLLSLHSMQIIYTSTIFKPSMTVLRIGGENKSAQFD